MIWDGAPRCIPADGRVRRVLIAVMAAALITGVVPLRTPLSAEATGSRIDRAAKRALADNSIQKTLPGLERTTAPRTPRETPQPPSRLPPRESGGEAIGGIGSSVLWILAIVAGLALLYFVLRELRSFRRGTGRRRFDEVEATAVEGRGLDGDGQPGDGLLADADALAARGEYGEAIHLILMHSLRRLEEVGEQVIGRSLTAREIVRRSTIAERARGLLSRIVGASELAHFGGRQADAEDYRSCREAFRQFSDQQTLGEHGASP